MRLFSGGVRSRLRRDGEGDTEEVNCQRVVEGANPYLTIPSKSAIISHIKKEGVSVIRKAQTKDIPRILDLLSQVNMVHHIGRPDLFKIGRKYSEAELTEILGDESRPILVWTDGDDMTQGYMFGIFQQHKNSLLLTDVKTLYIDDLCVEETLRGKHIGKELYTAAVALAKENDCYNLTLNVWSCNPSAMAFYESLGMSVQKIGMETIL